MTKLNRKIPYAYPLCVHVNCPKAESCLRQLAFQNQTESSTYMRIVNPSKCTCQSNCPFYVSSMPVLYARGFAKFKEQMFPAQYDKFMTMLIGYYGRNKYFKLRRGELAISPADQLVIKKALKKSGVVEDLDFDTYEETLNW